MLFGFYEDQEDI